ncbi:MAG: hypothetical protein K2N78_02875 [Oscillospiraceae bacterium]|nr:hypothetical protein [Oscillospiraceae bacterium]
MIKEELKALIQETVKGVLDEENPVYQDLKDVPEYWRPAASALLDAGAVNGGTPAEVCSTDLNFRKETNRAVVVGGYIPRRQREHEVKSKSLFKIF